jgi:hypothetical protein
MFATSHSCPRCACTAAHKSRRRLYDWPLLLLGFRAVRCAACSARFYRHLSRVERPESAV